MDKINDTDGCMLFKIHRYCFLEMIYLVLLLVDVDKMNIDESYEFVRIYRLFLREMIF